MLWVLMDRVLEVRPLLLAAATGAALYYLLHLGRESRDGACRAALRGAFIGAFVQLTVRAAGVS
jgi:hypothetical protein